MPDVVIDVIEEPVQVVEVADHRVTVVEINDGGNSVVEVAGDSVQVVDVIQYPVQVVEIPHSTGPRGAPGIPGVSIVGAEVDSEGNLIFTTSEGDTIEAGNVTGASGYTHHQGVSVSQWDITHDLGFTPNVTVVDSAGTVVEGEVIYLTDTSISVSFSYPFSGKAYLS